MTPISAAADRSVTLASHRVGADDAIVPGF
jgi:hypothetical protein